MAILWDFAYVTAVKAEHDEIIALVPEYWPPQYKIDDKGKPQRNAGNEDGGSKRKALSGGQGCWGQSMGIPSMIFVACRHSH